MQKVFLVFLFSLTLLPIPNAEAQVSNTGFVSANIWYSKDPFEEGDKIKIYTFIFNPDDRQLSGTVIFFDKTTLLGKKDFTVAGNSANDIYIEWIATLGEHTIFAKIENAKFLLSNGKYEEIYITENETQKSERKVKQRILENLLNTNKDNKTLAKVSDIAETIVDKTPDFIKTPINSTTNTVENWRADATINTTEKKEETKKEIADIKNPGSTNNETSKEKPSSLLKPWKYVVLFFFTLLSFILGHKLIFYGLLIFLIFLLLRYLWRKIL